MRATIIVIAILMVYSGKRTESHYNDPHINNLRAQWINLRMNAGLPNTMGETKQTITIKFQKNK